MPTNRPSQAGRSPARAARTGAARPLPPGDTLFTPGAPSAREYLERRSATVLLWLRQVPAWLPPLLAVALLVTGLAVPGVGGAAALGALAVVLGWLAAVSWPRLSAQGRLLRAATVAVILVIAVIRGTH